MSDRGFPTVVCEKKAGAGVRKESIKLIAWWFNVTDHLPWEGWEFESNWNSKEEKKLYTSNKQIGKT